MPDTLIAFTTCPDADSATHLARTLVDERLAACVSRMPGLTSVYRWEDRIEEADEVLLLIKTTHARFAALCERLQELHPYTLPELITVDIRDGLPAYLDWLAQAVDKRDL